MTHRNLLGQDAEDLRLVRKIKAATMQRTLAADLTITADMPHFMTLDPGGATRKLIMPLETNIDNIGLTFIVRNGADAAEDLTIRNNADSATVGTISQNEVATLRLMPAVGGGATYTWTVAMSAST
jgi:hypothetical protein